MRVNSEAFNTWNDSRSKELRLVVKADFVSPVYFTSHSDVTIDGADVVSGVLKKTTSSSQRLRPLEARSEIGSIGFELVDVDGLVTDKLREKDIGGEGLKGLFIESYQGGPSLAWSDYRVENTQVIDKQLSFTGVNYKFHCRDIQREMRKNIFSLASTRVSQNFVIGETTTLNVLTTEGFEPCLHGPEWGLNPSVSIYYLMLTTNSVFEIISATGKTDNTFTGITRGLFGTDEIDHNIPSGGVTDTSGTEVKEFVYLEGTAPHIAYQLLTGKNFSNVDTLPSTWHLGIDQSYIDQDSFINIGTDLHDPSDDNAGFILRGDGLTKEDGKRFIETEICRLMGAFPLVGSDGRIKLRRLASVLTDSPYIGTLDESNVTKISNYHSNFNDIKNILQIDWAYIATINAQKPDYYRHDLLIDGDSVAKHEASKPYVMRFKMLHTSRHTQTTLSTIFNGLRDRHAGPPERVTLDLTPNMNNIEVGDVFLVNLTSLPDYMGSSNLNRPMEVQHRKIDQVTGKVTVSLFGSSAKAAPLDIGASEQAELPNDWYSSAGTDLSTIITIDGSGFINQSDTILAGNTTREIYYYIGDLTISAGQTLTIEGNGELRVMGHLQIEGTLKIANRPGGAYLGSGFGGSSEVIGGPEAGTHTGEFVQGQVEAIPNLVITNNDGVFSGIPVDMRGIDGGDGAEAKQYNNIDLVYETFEFGGVGGGGGGSIVIISRGMGFGVSGEVDLSGNDGALATPDPGWPYPGAPLAVGGGSGMGGAPGCMVVLIDGTSFTFPVLAGNVTANYGDSPSPQPGDGGNALGVTTSLTQYVPTSPGGYTPFL